MKSLVQFCTDTQDELTPAYIFQQCIVVAPKLAPSQPVNTLEIAAQPNAVSY